MTLTNYYEGVSLSGLRPSEVTPNHKDRIIRDMLAYGASESLQSEVTRVLERIMLDGRARQLSCADGRTTTSMGRLPEPTLDELAERWIARRWRIAELANPARRGRGPSPRSVLRDAAVLKKYLRLSFTLPASSS